MFGKKEKFIEAELNAIKAQAEHMSDAIVEKVRGGVVDSVRKLINEQDTVTELRKEIAGLIGEKTELEAMVEGHKSKQRIQETEWKHALKMKEEKNALGIDRKEVELEGKFVGKEMELLKKHQEKLLALIKDNEKKQEKFFQDIMDRLPNANMAIKLSNQAEVSKDGDGSKSK